MGTQGVVIKRAGVCQPENSLVELGGIEPPPSCMPCKRSPSCAIAPRKRAFWGKHRPLSRLARVRTFRRIVHMRQRAFDAPQAAFAPDQAQSDINGRRYRATR